MDALVETAEEHEIENANRIEQKHLEMIEIKTKLNATQKRLNIMMKRNDEFNYIKAYYNKLREQIRVDIHNDIGSIAVLLRRKIDDFCFEVKEKLKITYKLVDDKHKTLNAKIFEYKRRIEEKIQSNETDSLVEFLNDIEMRLNEVEDELSGSTLLLYPNVYYTLDTKQLSDALEALKINMFEFIDANNNGQIEMKLEQLEMKLGRLIEVDCNCKFECIVTSGLSEYGIFWIQISNKQVNTIIEELNKVIRIKRISDSTWRTFSEQNKTPYIGERCFCFEKNSRKWLRALVDSYDTTENLCKIRYLDTGYIEPSVGLDNLLQWKDFDLLHDVKFQAIQCALIDFNREDFKKFLHDSKYFFRDNIYGQRLQCKLNEKIQSVYSCSNSDCWLVDLYSLDGQHDDKTINELIIEKNQDFYVNSATNSFASQDIRLTESNSNIVNIVATLSYGGGGHRSNVVSGGGGDSNGEENNREEAKGGQTQYNTDNTDADVNGEHEKTSDDHTDNIIVKSSMSNERVPILERKASCSTHNTDNEVNEVLNGILNDVERRTRSRSCSPAKATQSPPMPITQTSESANIRINSNASSAGSVYNAGTNGAHSGYHLSLTNVYDSDADDQTDDKRLHPGREGWCYISGDLTPQGIFWIKPFVEKVKMNDLERLAESINSLISNKHYGSYSTVPITPEVNKKCFVSFGPTVHECFRGLIESVNETAETCEVRLLDTGVVRTVQFYQMYPHKRLQDGTAKLHYRAIRCSFTRDPNPVFDQKFQQLFETTCKKRSFLFELLEQVQCNGIRCWFTKIMDRDTRADVIAPLYETYKEARKNSTSSQRSHSSKSDQIVDNQQAFQRPDRHALNQVQSQPQQQQQAQPLIELPRQVLPKQPLQPQAHPQHQHVQLQQQGFQRNQQQQKQSTKKPNNRNNCKSDSGQPRQNYHRRDDNDDNDFNAKRNYFNKNSPSPNGGYQSGGGQQRSGGGGGAYQNRSAQNSRGGGGQGYKYGQQTTATFKPYAITRFTNESYIVECGDEDDQDSSAYNDVFIEDNNNNNPDDDDFGDVDGNEGDVDGECEGIEEEDEEEDGVQQELIVKEDYEKYRHLYNIRELSIVEEPPVEHNQPLGVVNTGGLSHMVDTSDQVNFEDTLLDTSELANDNLERNFLSSSSHKSQNEDDDEHTPLAVHVNVTPLVQVSDRSSNKTNSAGQRVNQKIIHVVSQGDRGRDTGEDVDVDEDEDENESFASCADEMANGQFPRPPSIISMQIAMDTQPQEQQQQHSQPQQPSSHEQPNKEKSTKKFTVAIFVESFDYCSSASKSSDESMCVSSIRDNDNDDDGHNNGHNDEDEESDKPFQFAARQIIEDDTEVYAQRHAEYSRKFANRIPIGGQSRFHTSYTTGDIKANEQSQSHTVEPVTYHNIVSPFSKASGGSTSNSTITLNNNKLSSFAPSTSDSLFNSNLIITPVPLDHSAALSPASDLHQKVQQSLSFPLPPPPDFDHEEEDDENDDGEDDTDEGDEEEEEEQPLPPPPPPLAATAATSGLVLQSTALSPDTHTATRTQSLITPTTVTQPPPIVRHKCQPPPPPPPRNPNITLQSQALKNSFIPIQIRSILAERPCDLDNLLKQSQANRHHSGYLEVHNEADTTDTESTQSVNTELETMPPPPVEFQTTSLSTTTRFQPTVSTAKFDNSTTSRLNAFLSSLKQSNSLSNGSLNRSVDTTSGTKSNFYNIRNEFEMRSLIVPLSGRQQSQQHQNEYSHMSRAILTERLNQSCPIPATSVNNDAATTATVTSTSNEQFVPVQSTIHTDSFSPTLPDLRQPKQQLRTLKLQPDEDRPYVRQPPAYARQLKLDRAFDINPMRLDVGAGFKCRVHDKIDENGALWLEIIYADDEELKFHELFKMFNLWSILSMPPQYTYIGQHVSALYKNKWQRAVVLNDVLDRGCMVKVRYIDTGRIKFVDRYQDLREVDEKFFNAPNKSLYCTIRLEDSVKLSTEMRKFFSVLTFKKLLSGKILGVCKDNFRDLWRVELVCEVPNGYVNIYPQLLLKFNRKAYEQYKRERKQQRRVVVLSNEEQCSTSSSAYTESGAVSDTNEFRHNERYGNDVYRLDTLNEETINSLDTNIEDYNDIEFNIADKREMDYDARHVDNCNDLDDHEDDDDDDDVSIDDGAFIENFCENEMFYQYTSGRPQTTKKQYNHDDLYSAVYKYKQQRQQTREYAGLDMTPVNLRAQLSSLEQDHQSPQHDQLNDLDERYRNLNIKPIEIIDTNVNVIEHLKNVNAANSHNNNFTSYNNNPNLVNNSDTDSSVPVKCCAKTFKKKLSSIGSCCKSAFTDKTSKQQRTTVHKPKNK